MSKLKNQCMPSLVNAVRHITVNVFAKLVGQRIIIFRNNIVNELAVDDFDNSIFKEIFLVMCIQSIVKFKINPGQEYSGEYFPESLLLFYSLLKTSRAMIIYRAIINPKTNQIGNP